MSGDVSITGSLRLKGSGNYGNVLNFGDSDYVHLSEPTDDSLEIKANSVNFVVSGDITKNNAKLAMASHTHSASDITSGTLSSSRMPTVPVSKGGTGATTASSALSNLGAFPVSGGTINGAVNINGALDVKSNTMHLGSGNSGAKLNFGDSDFVHFYENTDDNLEIKAKNINFVVTGSVTQNGSKLGGGDFTITSSVPSSLSSGQVAFIY